MSASSEVKKRWLSIGRRLGARQHSLGGLAAGLSCCDEGDGAQDVLERVLTIIYHLMSGFRDARKKDQAVILREPVRGELRRPISVAKIKR